MIHSIVVLQFHYFLLVSKASLTFLAIYPDSAKMLSTLDKGIAYN